MGKRKYIKLDNPFLWTKLILNNIIKPGINIYLTNKIKNPKDIIPTFLFREIITKNMKLDKWISYSTIY